MNFRRIWRLVRKELIQTRRDKRMLGILFIAPIFQLFLFGYAISTDINHVPMAIFDEDRSAASRALITRLESSGYFEEKAYLTNYEAVNTVLDAGNVEMVLHIPHGFTRDLGRNHTAIIQTILDGSDSMTARVVTGYAEGVMQQYSGTIMLQHLQRHAGSLSRLPGIDARLRVWYNPELRSVNFMVPGVMCMILLVITTMMTSMAIVKEKEIGTLEQLIVTPITAAELMLGKTLPFLAIGLFDMLLVLLAAVGWFHVAVAGSILLLVLLTILFLVNTLGLGIFISTISKSQHEATLTTFFFLLPFILLSGFIFPIENMPIAMQWITYAIPLRYFLEIVRGIFLRGNGIAVLWPQILILAAFGVGILALSASRFRKRVG